MVDKTILLDKGIIEQGKAICKFITEPDVRNRAVANVIAAKVVGEFFANYDFDSETSLHNIYQILDKWDISDVYINGAYVDVRLYFNEEELCVPKSHYDNGLLPIFYMFVKLDEDLSSAEITGFMLPQSVQKENLADDYYFITERELVSFDKVESLITAQEVILPENYETLIFDFLDGRLSQDNEFFKVLLSSKSSREKFIDIAKTQNVFKFVSIDSAFENNTAETIEQDVNQDVSLLFDDESSANIDISASLEDENILINNDFINELESDALDETFDILSDDVEQNTEIELSDDEYKYSTEITPGIETIENDLNDFPEEELSAEEDKILEENTESLIINADEELSLIEEDNLENLSEVSEDYSTEDNIVEIEDNFEDEFSEISDDVITTNFEEEVAGKSDEDEILDIIDTEDTDISQEEAVNNDFRELSEEIVDDSEAFDNILSEDSENVNDNDNIQAIEENDVITNEAEQINTLFSNDTEDNTADLVNELPRKKNFMLPFIGIVALVGAFGYYSYNKFILNNNNSTIVSTPVVKTEVKKEPIEPMPIETIEDVKNDIPTEEGNAIALPAIEKSLDASILVSNLSINWEVPSSYVSNNVAKRYFTKLGKIIQLNLKTELLLLSKPPITNKIVLDLEFNKNLQKFTIKSISLSSGEKAVDDIIEKTVNTALSSSMSSNMAIFGTLQGNPSLVIRL